MSTQPLKTTRLYQQLADRIKTQIVHGELLDGDQLPNERDLSTQYGVSRTVVREAMKALSQEGLVEIRPGRGTFVVSDTAEAIKRSLGNLMMVDSDENWEDLVEVRELLEPGIAYLAAKRGLTEHIEAMSEAVDIMDKSLEEADAYIAADNKFHISMAKATGNRLIISLLDPIIGLLIEQRRYVFRSKHGGPRAGQVFHKQILEAIKNHDPDGAHAAMVGHLDQVRRDTDPSEARHD